MVEQFLHRRWIELIDALKILGVDAPGHEQAIDPEAVGAGQISPHRIPDRQNAVELDSMALPLGGKLHGAVDLLAHRYDLLHEADLAGARRGELIAQQQMIHRVAPPRARQKAEVRTAQRGDPAFGFHLAEPAVIGRDDPVTTQAIFAFVTLRGGNEGSEALSKELREHVVKSIGSIARPKTIMFTPELPKTRSGKIMRRLLRDIANGQPLGDTTTLADATVVETIRGSTGKED